MRVLDYFMLLLVGWFLGPGLPVAAQSTGQWQLRKDKDQIKVYTRPIEGSRTNEIKVICTFPGTKSQLVALLSDVDNYRQVIYKTKTAHKLKQQSDAQFLYYVVNELPVVQDRDMAVQLSFTQDPVSKVLYIKGVGVPNVVPEKKGIVRISDWLAEWQVVSEEKNKLKITYYCRIDPGGTIPPWVQNFVAADGVYNSFMLIRNSLSLPRYQGRTFSFLRE